MAMPYSGVSDVPRHTPVSDVPKLNSTAAVVKRAQFTHGRALGLISSSISVTSAAIGERSLRSSVIWANSG